MPRRARVIAPIEPVDPEIYAYRVVGPHAVDGVEHGGIVEIELARAERLYEAGHIAPVDDSEVSDEAPVSEDLDGEDTPSPADHRDSE